MRHLLNTLYVLTPENYLSLENENVLVNQDKSVLARFPLHTLEGIVSFTYAGASPALMGACAARGIDLSFFSPQGRFLARTTGEPRGNVLLRIEQCRIADDAMQSCRFARNFILGKVFNARWVIERAIRDHAPRIPIEAFQAVSQNLKSTLAAITDCADLQQLRGLEGEAAKQYFGIFGALILQQQESFPFALRSRRPPTDRVNAMLSFAYTLLARDCAAALNSVGLDPYIGFMHRPRPGRSSLALDLMEELRPILADRFVISCINHRLLSASDFATQENGAVLLTDSGRKAFLSAWQSRKQQSLTHPFLREKIVWGLVCYIQALLLARTIRGDMEEYPPFLWK